MTKHADLTGLVAGATRRAFESTAAVSLQSAGTSLATFLGAHMPSFVARASGAFAVEFASALLGTLLHSDDSIRRIESGVSKLAREPMTTALEQFRVASLLRPSGPDEQAHREQRFRECLATLDRARSLAEQNEVPIINLLSGVCALQVRGGTGEAAEHLGRYARACQDQAEDLRTRARIHEGIATRKEAQAGEVVVPNGGAAGGGLIGMDVAEPRMARATLLHEARSLRVEAEEMRRTSEELATSATCVGLLIEVARMPADAPPQ